MAASDPNFPVAGLARDGWSTEEEATATCFCGAVQLVFPIQGPGLINRHVCHCSDCRKISSGLYMSNITVADTHLRDVRGRAELRTFAQATTVRSGGLMTNYFCATCGTLMYRVGEKFPGLSILRTGTVDDFSLAEGKLRPQVEQFVENRAAWQRPIEGVPQVVGMSSAADIEGAVL
ncbi:Mss4-like protein [Chaetomium tenue]|uniref:Mss4-like protein n=1 Tax=Chaetomium tenue TaxID=1854479 RepID=A0ACB7P9S2_9PEZI|nr:Mss4-like protein [Chaetomium globosum]